MHFWSNRSRGLSPGACAGAARSVRSPRRKGVSDRGVAGTVRASVVFFSPYTRNRPKGAVRGACASRPKLLSAMRLWRVKRFSCLHLSGGDSRKVLAIVAKSLWDWELRAPL